MTQIVPSKNALRALRKLALGGSTVVGAVGSISGLALVSHDIRQRIHLAESIVETKRVLQSQPVYNAHRKTHMAAIFDMYENGQGKEESESWRDFNRRARRHSKQQHLNTGDPHPGDTEISSNAMLPADSGKKRTEFKLSSQRDLNSSTAQKIIEATQKQHKVDSHTVYGRPRESRNISPVQKIIAATQQQHKVDSHVVFGRPQKTEDAALPDLASSVREWLAPLSEDRQHVSQAKPSNRLNASRQLTRHYACIRRYSTSVVQIQPEPKPPFLWPSSNDSGSYFDPYFTNDTEASDTVQKLKSHDDEFVPMSQPYRAMRDAKPEQSQTTTKDITNGLDVATDEASTFGLDVSRELTTLMERNVFGREKNDDKNKYQLMKDISAFSCSLILDPTQSFHDPVLLDAYNSMHTKEARCLTTTKTSDEIFEHSAVFGQVTTTIAVLKRENGLNTAREFAIQAMHIYAASGTSADYRAINDLSLRFGKELRLSVQNKPMFELVRYLLSTELEDDRKRVGSLLFSRGRRHDRQALRYITWLCSTDVSSLEVVKEFRKVIEVAYERGMPPVEGFYYPILHMFLKRGELKYLHNIFDEMQAAHGVVASSHTRKLLLLGYAKASDWEQVTTEFEKMHRAGVSRKEPISYAMMFDEVFREYVASEPVEKIHDFLVNAIYYWGLIPVSAVSATAVAAYIRHRRYDLIKEWTEGIGRLFPQLTTSGRTFTLTLAKTWEEIGASCEDIEEACMSIFPGRDSIVPGRFKGIVQSALAGHLASKIHITKLDGEASDDHGCESGPSDDLSSQLKSAFAIVLQDAGDNGVVMRDSVADLLDQTNAALRLRKFLGAQTNITTPEVSLAMALERSAYKKALPNSEAKALSATIPPELRRKLLPDIATVTSLVLNHYSQVLKRGEHIDHAILEVTCRQLSLTHRYYEIAGLIAQIYKGPAVQGPDGVMFNLNIIQLWLEAAYSLKSAQMCMEIFRVVLDKGTEIRLTDQFILLAEMTAQKPFQRKFSHPHRKAKGKYAEEEFGLEAPKAVRRHAATQD